MQVILVGRGMTIMLIGECWVVIYFNSGEGIPYFNRGV